MQTCAAPWVSTCKTRRGDIEDGKTRSYQNPIPSRYSSPPFSMFTVHKLISFIL